jgi:hypothetical protein
MQRYQLAVEPILLQTEITIKEQISNVQLKRVKSKLVGVMLNKAVPQICYDVRNFTGVQSKQDFPITHEVNDENEIMLNHI